MDPFQTLVHLEEQYYAEGFALGSEDGAKAGRAEGRQFGMEKGFEKFSELGRLHGRATLLQRQPGSANGASDRLQKHLARLSDLTSIERTSTENSEDGVADVDDRLREAKAKSSLIAKISGKDQSNKSEATRMRASNELEDFDGLGKRGNKS